MIETGPPLPGRKLPEVVTPFHKLLAMFDRGRQGMTIVYWSRERRRFMTAGFPRR